MDSNFTKDMPDGIRIMFAEMLNDRTVRDGGGCAGEGSDSTWSEKARCNGPHCAGSMLEYKFVVRSTRGRHVKRDVQNKWEMTTESKVGGHRFLARAPLEGGRRLHPFPPLQVRKCRECSGVLCGVLDLG